MIPSVLVRLDAEALEGALAAAKLMLPGAAPAELLTGLARGLGFGSAEEAAREGERYGGLLWDGIDGGMAAFLTSRGSPVPPGMLREILSRAIVDHDDVADMGHDDRGRLQVLLTSAFSIDRSVMERRPLDTDHDNGGSFGISVYSRNGAPVFKCGVHAHHETHALALAGRHLAQCWRTVQIGLGLQAAQLPRDIYAEVEIEMRPVWQYGLEYIHLEESLMSHAFRMLSGRRKLVTTARLRELGVLLLSTDPAVRKLWSSDAPGLFSLRWMGNVRSRRIGTQISPWPTIANQGVGLTETTREVLQVMAIHRSCNVRTSRLDGRFIQRCDPPASATLRALLSHPLLGPIRSIDPVKSYLESVGLPGLGRRVEMQAGL